MPFRASLLPLSFFLLLLSACHDASDSSSSSTTEALPFRVVPLNNLDEFQNTKAANWRTVGSVYADRQVAEDLQPAEGEGALANLPDEQNRANLFTRWEHGDMDLSLDFMMAQGSNSGIYLQGRYEVQLLDSWGKDSIGSGDCGGIYQRWKEAEQLGYEGHAPRLNACRAPGLWQRLDIQFKAPRFDAQGNKIANARFTSVKLNGATVQEDVEVTGPTRAAAFDDEKPFGPLMIQGDHGPVAIQNIRYKTYETTPVKLVDLNYQVYKGVYENPDALAEAEAAQQGSTDSISYLLGKDYEQYALVFEGELDVPKEGNYLFALRSAGPSWLYLNGKQVTSNQNANYLDQVGRYQTSLTAGRHPFRLVYTKYELKWVYGLSLYCEGPQVRRHALHAPGSVPQAEQPEPIPIQVGNEPIVQRTFLYHQDEKKTHCATVGLPVGINYAIDIKGAALLATWGGDFIDVADMWHERGEPQTAQPLGSALEFSDKPSLARLGSRSDPWPDSVSFEQPHLQTKGYSIDGQGTPVFHYQLGTALINDHFYGGNAERKLVRDINCTFTDTSGDPVYCLLAEGDQIEELPDGSYGIDGKRYYLTIDQMGNNRLQQRTERGKEQLLATLTPEAGKASLQYAITW